ncbi:MAG TPA: hypothetical protein VF572_06280 [Candidatus Saccharimonadales bacterium]|jgi:hypothetical protein
MDFRGRNSQTSGTPAAQPAASGASTGGTFGGHQYKIGKQPVGKLFQLGSIILLFTVTALVLALTFLISQSGNAQQRAVDKDRYQAVFLNNGQVYFGNINDFTSSSVDLRNIYYLQTSANGETAAQATSASNVSLVKLGCELHAPYDQMLINKDQVIFWENIKDDSQVVKAIADYKKQNADGKCSQASQSSTQQAPSTTAPTTNPTTTAPAANTPTTTTPRKP